MGASVDIKEESDKFVYFVISQLNPEDIEVSMEAGVLTVKAKESEAKLNRGYNGWSAHPALFIVVSVCLILLMAMH